MHKKRNIRLLLSLVALTCLTSVAYFISKKEAYTVANPDMFKVEDFKTIDRILLESKTDTVNIAFDGTRWRLNNEHNADRQMIDLLFATLQQVTPKRPLATNVRDSVARNLITNGVRVSLYRGEGLQKTFYAGGNPQKSQAYFVDPETSTPYLMAIPGYRVYAAGILELDKNGWRDKYAFGFNWRNFERMEVSFPAKPSDNFAVSMTDDFFGIEGVQATDTSRLNTFLDNVSLLMVSQYLKKEEINTDSLSHEQPDIRIVVKDIGKREYSLSIYLTPEDTKEIIGLLNDIQPVLFNYRDIRNIVKPKSHFLGE